MVEFFLGHEKEKFMVGPWTQSTIEHDSVIKLLDKSKQYVGAFYDPINGPPIDPKVGDRYISLETAFDWHKDYIYEWNGHIWIQEIPTEGDTYIIKSGTRAGWTVGYFKNMWKSILYDDY